MNWITEHWPAILGTVYALLNLANALIKDPEAKSILGKLVDAISVLTRSGASGTLKAPLASSRLKNGVHVALMVMLVLPAMAGCATALDRARQTVSTVATAERATAEMVIDIDRETQDDIAEQLELDHDVTKAKAARDEWRAKRKQVRQALKTTHAFVVGGSVGLELAAQGGKVDLGAIIAQGVKVLVALKGALAAFGHKLPGGLL